MREKIPSDPVVGQVEGWSLVRDRTNRKHCPSHQIWSYKRDMVVGEGGRSTGVLLYCGSVD